MSDDDYMLWSTSNHECTVTLSRWRSTIIDHHGAMKPTLVYFPQGWAQLRLNRDPPFTSLQIIWGSCRVGDLQQALGTFGLVLQDLRCLGCNLGRVAEAWQCTAGLKMGRSGGDLKSLSQYIPKLELKLERSGMKSWKFLLTQLIFLASSSRIQSRGQCTTPEP